MLCLFSGVSSGLYAHPVTAYFGRRKRGAEDLAPGDLYAFSSDASDGMLLQQLIRSQTMGRNKKPNVILSSEEKPTKKLFTWTNSEKYGDVAASESGKIVFRDDTDKDDSPWNYVADSKRRKRAIDGLTISSPTIRVADDPMQRYRMYQVPSTKPTIQQTKTMRFPEEKDLPLAYRGTSLGDRRSRQRLDCDDVEGRNTADHFGLLMLEGALSEDENGCGLSLICEIGRTPLTALPPKALGLRRMLT